MVAAVGERPRRRGGPSACCSTPGLRRCVGGRRPPSRRPRRASIAVLQRGGVGAGLRRRASTRSSLARERARPRSGWFAKSRSWNFLATSGPYLLQHERRRSRWPARSSGPTPSSRTNGRYSTCTLPSSASVRELLVGRLLELPAERAEEVLVDRPPCAARRSGPMVTPYSLPVVGAAWASALVSSRIELMRKPPPTIRAIATTTADHRQDLPATLAALLLLEGGGGALGAEPLLLLVGHGGHGQTPDRCGRSRVEVASRSSRSRSRSVEPAVRGGRAGCRARAGCGAARRGTARAASSPTSRAISHGYFDGASGSDAAAAEAAAVDLDAARPDRRDADDERDEQQRRDRGRPRVSRPSTRQTPTTTSRTGSSWPTVVALSPGSSW